jgi:hypothetical protein
MFVRSWRTARDEPQSAIEQWLERETGNEFTGTSVPASGPAETLRQRSMGATAMYRGQRVWPIGT